MKPQQSRLVRSTARRATGRWRAGGLAALTTAWLLPQALHAQPDQPMARTFFVNSAIGDDSATGRSTAKDGANGPWKTLARLARADLAPGDKVLLACGSIWNETLTINASGTAAKPITVSAPDPPCQSPPAIDGSTRVPVLAQPGTQRQVVKFSQVPLQLHGGGTWLPAHHPNRGHDVARPQSHYLRMPGDGASTVQAGRKIGTGMLTGPALVLPAGATIELGTKVHVRTTAWALEERRVSAASAGTVTFDTTTVYPALAGWGYFFSGQAWMVDSPGEWHHDPGTQQLTLWRPAGAATDAPVLATVLPVGADLSDRAHVVLRGLAMRHVGLGLQLRRTQSVRLLNLLVEDTAGIGIAASGSVNLTIADSTLRRTGEDAIQGMATGTATDADGLQVLGNTIEDSGVLRVDGINQGLPVRSYAAIYGGPRALIEHNTIRRSGYIGIRFMRDSRVLHNTVEDSCLVLNDCAGIYTWGKEPNNGLVANNLVIGAEGNLDGAVAGMASAAQGIYLDEDVSGVTVSDNTVTGADNGVQVHMARQSSIRGNRLYGNRRSQIWLQATANKQHPDGDVAGIQVVDNLLANTLPNSLGVLLQTRWGSTAHFGSFERNRYLDTANAVLVREQTQGGIRNFDFPQWQLADRVGSAQARDSNGFSARSQPFSSHATAGSNLVDNAAFSNDTAGWQTWSPKGSTIRMALQPCPAKQCLRVATGDAAGLLSTPGFDLQQGDWYRLSFDAQADTAGRPLQIQVRRNGAGAQPYAPVADRPLDVVVDKRWQRHALVFRATQSTGRSGAGPAAPGARIDFEGLAPGVVFGIGHVELLRLTPDLLPSGGVALVNRQAGPQSLPCPLDKRPAARCASLHSLATGRPVVWPLALPGHSSDIFFLQDPSLADDDRDGIPDWQDQCPGSPQGEAVDAMGCTMPAQ